LVTGSEPRPPPIPSANAATGREVRGRPYTPSLSTNVPNAPNALRGSTPLATPVHSRGDHQHPWSPSPGFFSRSVGLSCRRGGGWVSPPRPLFRRGRGTLGSLWVSPKAGKLEQCRIFSIWTALFVYPEIPRGLKTSPGPSTTTTTSHFTTPPVHTPRGSCWQNSIKVPLLRFLSFFEGGWAGPSASAGGGFPQL